MERIYDAVFAVSAALEGPVVLASLLALLAVVAEAGVFTAEVVRRRGRSLERLETAGTAAREALADGDLPAAQRAAADVGHGEAMVEAARALVEVSARPQPDAGVAKRLADFDVRCERRLARTRLLVRLGPALGLMGTLIPLSPALEGLARGDVATLADNLRVAFSITVLGLLVGAGAFALSLVRERLYGQDFSDLEYLAALLTEPGSGPS
ncbi:MotA/TolQ/ExbB proton channel family protein [Nocardioides sp. TRM66260-LWL]|uniref:MotA/TolQ/ExbB proton channel family protein n=1 Tax=Nocardioides sp. TRM66260-LWL TaxID=2874478 RepID=UPI001CC4B531|nr:MotA/TolQ/ExbB proton channel family protein [Nocardioides sp. TRM66260-LWL]MBZ5735060.1 MotA/TolQ/ExbB proton channel family protein [Nocardioides sp. TRM66260-LWL]